MSDHASLYLVMGLAVAMYIAWNLGANDSANPTNAAVGSGALSLRKAMILFSVFAAIGAIVQGYMVMKTIGKGVVKDLDPLAALIASLIAGIWITFSTWKGLPVSTTHSTVGAVIGIGFAYSYFHGHTYINWHVVTMIVASWVVSPLLAILLSMLMYNILRYIAQRRSVEKVAPLFKKIMIIGLVASAYAFGVNDVGNATGVYVTVVSKLYGLPDATTMRYLAALGSVGIALGALTWGYRVVNTVGYKITRLDYVTGAAALLTNAIIVWGFSTIPKWLWNYGMPISTTHASVSSIIGVGIARSRSLSGVDWKVVGIIVASWIITLPVAAGASFAIYSLTLHLIS